MQQSEMITALDLHTWVRNNFSSMKRYNVKLWSFELSPLRDIMLAGLQELHGETPGAYIT